MGGCEQILVGLRGVLGPVAVFGSDAMSGIDRHLADRGLVRLGDAAKRLNVRHEQLSDLGKIGKIEVSHYDQWGRSYLVITESEFRRLAGLLRR